MVLTNSYIFLPNQELGIAKGEDGRITFTRTKKR